MLKENTVLNREEIETAFVRPELKTKIYLDTVKLDITANIVFVYGDKDIFYGSKLFFNILREPEKEYKIYNILECAGFVVSQSGIFQLQGDDKIYNFFIQWLEELKSHGEIYVSDSFAKKALNAGSKLSIG